MGPNLEFIEALERGDFRLAARMAAAAHPHLPKAETDEQAEIALHMARTQIPQVQFRLRAYSHAWLSERGLPSQLPDHLRPRADRLYPKVAEAVFVSANSNSPLLKPAMPLVQKAMSGAVEEVYADTRSPDPMLVRGRIAEARRKTLKLLFG